MNLEEAKLIPDKVPSWVPNLVKESAEGATQTFTWFITTLYAQGYIILSPKEVKFYEKRLNER